MNAVERMSPKFSSCAAACRGLPREENIMLFGGGGWGKGWEVCALAGMDWRFRRRGERGFGMGEKREESAAFKEAIRNFVDRCTVPD
jgi:hypothetical protein